MGLLQFSGLGESLRCGMGLSRSHKRAMNMKVLHICSDYAKQTLYKHLVASLAGYGIKQFVYVPTRTAEEAEVNRIEDQDGIWFAYAHILRKFHRVFFRTKIRRVAKDLLSRISILDYKVIHAHFLYSDGAVARQLNKQFGVPYILAVRNTDINSFMKLRPDLRLICWDILRNASQIVFLTPAYSSYLMNKAPVDVKLVLAERSLIVPNGISEFWLEEPLEKQGSSDQTLKLLYVGDFTPNKNIIGTMKAVKLLTPRLSITLTIVGGGGADEEKVVKLSESGEFSFVTLLGRIDSPVKLREIYRRHDIFVMPSFFETFGLAYIEALSQGLPVIHSIGQGVAGHFDANGVAEPVDPKRPESISEGIAKLAKRLPEVRVQCAVEARKFSWKRISGEYIRVYEEAAGRSKYPTAKD